MIHICRRGDIYSRKMQKNTACEKLGKQSTDKDSLIGLSND